MFLLQKELNENFLSVEYAIWKDLLESSKQKYIEISNDELSLINNVDFKKEHNIDIKQCIPLGTIEFTNSFFNRFYNIKKMNPVEVPACLRTDEFLKRQYSIIKGNATPKTGRFFIKNVSDLKSFTFCGDIEHLFNSNNNLPNIDNEKFYQVSEIIDIISEYRIYVIQGKIYAVAYYDGDPCIFPDMKLINKANIIYSFQKDYLKSYTMDVAITDKGTCILEVHPLFSCGIYQTVLGTDFLQGYKDAMQYVLKFNNEPIEFSNF